MEKVELAQKILEDLPEAIGVYIDFHAFHVLSENAIDNIFDKVAVETAVAAASSDMWINNVCRDTSIEETLLEKGAPYVGRDKTAR